ncbi:MAG: zinc ribbon domain-containing protein [Coriobacteriales bacterium]|jgi:hypothetical protein|nr:zinc ribbon domain-containing protein [Coriobacteriales bacterium]
MALAPRIGYYLERWLFDDPERREMQCPSCGLHVLEGSNYCPSCGYRINAGLYQLQGVKPSSLAPSSALAIPAKMTPVVCHGRERTWGLFLIIAGILMTPVYFQCIMAVFLSRYAPALWPLTLTYVPLLLVLGVTGFYGQRFVRRPDVVTRTGRPMYRLALPDIIVSAATLFALLSYTLYDIYVYIFQSNASGSSLLPIVSLIVSITALGSALFLVCWSLAIFKQVRGMGAWCVSICSLILALFVLLGLLGDQLYELDAILYQGLSLVLEFHYYLLIFSIFISIKIPPCSADTIST